MHEEERTAHALYDAVKLTRDSGSPELRQRYDCTLDSIRSLQHYFAKMAETFESIAEEAAKLAEDLGESISDSKESLHGQNERMMF